jgi:hypothetical protein
MAKSYSVVVLFLCVSGGNMDIVGLLRKERLALMGKVNAVDAALRLLSGGVRQAKRVIKPSVPDERRRRISVAMKANWRKRRAAQKKK